MRIYLKGYLARNLGDDLFVKTIVERYKTQKFYTISNEFDYNNYNYLKVYSNSLLYRVIRKFKLEKNLASLCDISVTIGGSMYMECADSDKDKDFRLGKNKHYILGCNFGPYKTEEYFNKVKKAFESAEDVCFREEYSYNLFKDLKNVRYAPDILFSLDTSKVKITNRKRAVISIISCKYKLKESYTSDYENKIIELIKYLIDKGYEICLMSFCQKEKDEEEIESILSKCDIETKNKIETYYYRGNIEEALNTLGDSSLVIGSRFHANILAMVLGKPVIPVIYSDKMNHVLEDMKANLKTIDIRQIKDFDVNSITDEDLSKIINIDQERKESLRHFEKLDEILMGENK